MKPLASRWADIDQRCMPVDITDATRTSSKDLFYTGAFSVLCILSQWVEKRGADDVTVQLIALLDECNDYASNRKRGLQ